jgi:putative salt-induced outer membrane protein YdiY
MALRDRWVQLSALALMAVAPLAALAEEAPEKPPAWTGQVSLAGSLAAGNSDVFAATFEASAERAWESNEVRLGLFAVYGRSNGDTDSDKQSATGEWRRYLSERLFAYGSTEVGRDGIQEIRWRLVATVGPGWRAWKAGEEEYLDLETGLGYRHEDYSGDRSALHAADLRAALHYQDRWGAYLEFSQTAEFLMPVNQTGDWLGRSETVLALPLGEAWRFRNSLRVDYLNNPAAGNEKYDLLVGVGLEYRF